MRTLFLIAIAALLLLLSSRVLAAGSATPSPAMKPDWSPFEFLNGTWVCHSTIVGGKPVKQTVQQVTSMAFDNHWLVTKSDVPPLDPKRTKHDTVVNYIGWDPQNRLWYGWTVSNSDTPLAYITSSGWRGRTFSATAYSMKNGAWTTEGRGATTKISDTRESDVFYNEKGTLEFQDMCDKQT